MWRQNVKLFQMFKKNVSEMGLCTHSEKNVSIKMNDIVKPPELNDRIETLTLKSYLQGTKSKSKVTSFFDEVPGPAGLKAISKMWSLFPMMGTETTTRIIRYLLQKDSGKEPGKLLFKRVFDQYGPIVKLHGVFGSDVVLLCKPEHANIVLSCQKPFYVRSYFDSVEKYRQEWRKYTRNGPFLKFEEDWETLRKYLQDSDLSMSTEYKIDETLSDQFIQKIVEIRNAQGELSDGLKPQLYKWSLECLSMAVLNKEFGFLNQNFISPTSDPGRLRDGLTGATEALKKLEFGFHFWKFTDTPTFHALIKNCNLIDGVLSKYVQKAMKSLRERKEKELHLLDLSLIESLLLDRDLVEEDIMTILLDTFLISANAASHTVALLLFHLAKNPRIQIKLHEEIVNKGELVTPHNIDKKDYLNACIKESLRLDPPIPIVSRQLENDIILNHYRIAKDTHIFYSTYLNSNREEYFEEAPKFKPERWLPNDLGEYGREYQTFATDSFGFGPHATFVREILHIQIARLLVNIVLKFKIEFNYGEIKSNMEFLAPNNKPIKLRFVNRIK